MDAQNKPTHILKMFTKYIMDFFVIFEWRIRPIIIVAVWSIQYIAVFKQCNGSYHFGMVSTTRGGKFGLNILTNGHTAKLESVYVH